MNKLNEISLKKVLPYIFVALLLIIIALLATVLLDKDDLSDSNREEPDSGFSIKNSDGSALSSGKTNTENVDIELRSVEVGTKVVTANFTLKNSDIKNSSQSNRFVASSKCPTAEEMRTNQLYGKCFEAKLDESFMVDTTSGNRYNPLTDNSGNLNVTKFGDGIQVATIEAQESTSFYIQFERPPGNPNVTFNLNFSQALGPVELRKK